MRKIFLILAVVAFCGLDAYGLRAATGNIDRLDAEKGQIYLNGNNLNLTAAFVGSGTNTGDETLATIKSKLGITTLSGSNTGDE